MIQTYLYDNPAKTTTAIKKVSLVNTEVIISSLDELNQFMQNKKSAFIAVLFSGDSICLQH